MNGLLIYLLEASAVTALLYACYFLLMRKETCFGLNRAILAADCGLRVRSAFAAVARTGPDDRSFPCRCCDL